MKAEKLLAEKPVTDTTGKPVVSVIMSDGYVVVSVACAGGNRIHKHKPSDEVSYVLPSHVDQMRKFLASADYSKLSPQTIVRAWAELSKK